MGRDIRSDGHKADLGYVIARPEWSKGYATEAVQSVVNWAIEQPRIMRVWALCDVDNDASAWVLGKVRMKREGVIRRFIGHPTVSKEPRGFLLRTHQVRIASCATTHWSELRYRAKITTLQDRQQRSSNRWRGN